jgi:hypothetical protein
VTARAVVNVRRRARFALGWDAGYVAGAPGGPPLPEDLAVAVPEHETTLVSDRAVRGFDGDARCQLLCLEPTRIDPDQRGAAGRRDDASAALRAAAARDRRPRRVIAC